jgi:imidazole glycerol-phosphate synthase subunit HisH
VTIVVDYGMGNIGSILNMLKRIGVKASLSSTPAEIRAAERLILPGVGAFDTAMQRLNASGLVDVLTEQVIERRTPVLGICLGMQLLARGSEEGTLPGLGWFDATAVRFRFPPGPDAPRVPHMGWNSAVARPGTRLFHGLENDARFYFAHSFHVVCTDEADIAARTSYGGNVVAAVERGHIMGTQFHPEKSHKFGMRVLQNFAASA